MEDIPQLLANSRPRMNLNRLTHVKRSLQGKGKIKVSQGYEVMPSDILGVYTVSAGFSSVNLAQRLGVDKASASRFLKKNIGEKIFEGELLAIKKNLFGEKIVLSPSDGIIESYSQDSGELKLRYLDKEISLTAGVYGIIDHISSDKTEILIKTYATEIFGIAGIGQERGGIINIIGTRDNLASKDKIKPNMNQDILVVGALIYWEALHKAVEWGINGIITGGMNARDFKSISGGISNTQRIGSDSSLTILIVEGFGPIPIGNDIYDQLLTYVGKFAFIDGNTSRILLPSGSSDSIISLRKTALPITLKPEGAINIEYKPIEIGKKVRLIWPPFMGYQGKIIGIDKTITKLESGISTYLLTVDTPSRKLKVPYPNVEIIE